MSRPSDAFEQNELREEYDWIYEFQSRMAERITGDKDVHNLVDYVDKLEAENAKLRELLRIMHGELVSCEDNGYVCGGHKFDERVRELGIEVV